MKMTLKISLVAVLAAAVGACAVTAQQVSSLRGSDVAAADVAPVTQTYAGKMPGQQALIPRSFKEEPPLIPHSIDGFDEITATGNACLDCHISDTFNGKKMPRVGQSHLRKPASVGAAPELNMQRWQCNSCHVAQTDARPLVGNDFKGNLARP